MKVETDILKDLIRIKHECLLHLRELVRKQLALIEEENMTSLMDVLAAKQRPLITLQRIQRALEPFRNQDPEKRAWRSAEERAQCAEQLRQCEILLAEIVSQEKYCETALICRRDEAAVRLQGAHLAGQARESYLPQMNAPLPQLDLFSER